MFGHFLIDHIQSRIVFGHFLIDIQKLISHQFYFSFNLNRLTFYLLKSTFIKVANVQSTTFIFNNIIVHILQQVPQDYNYTVFISEIINPNFFVSSCCSYCPVVLTGLFLLFCNSIIKHTMLRQRRQRRWTIYITR